MMANGRRIYRELAEKNAKPVTPGKQVDCGLAKALSKCRRELFSVVMVTFLGGAAASCTQREGALGSSSNYQ